MTKAILWALALICVAITPAHARNLAVPANNPVATLTIPDNWKGEQIEFGYSAQSPDGNLAFYVEYASAARIDKLFATNDEWMKENRIKPNGEPTKREMTLGGLPATLFSYQATDENGPTEIDFVVIPANKRIILLTLWGSADEQKANKADLDIIQNSIKAIN